MVMTPASGLPDTLPRITSAPFLNATQAASMKADLLVILTINEDIKEYYQELKLIVDL
jgi:hypothetical protein